MALIKVDYFSQALMRTVSMNVLIPTDKVVMGEPLPKTFKTLYLLHGIFGNHTDWLCGTRIQRWAQDKNLAVVMPAGENKFYVDNENSGDNFGRFIGQELVEFTRRTFPLSHKREDTFIGGLSMGGYGALRGGLKYNQTFGAIIALSSALILEGVVNSEYKDTWDINNRYYYESVFGRDLSGLRGGDMDYFALAEDLLKRDEVIPRLYLACGTEDFLYQPNLQYHHFLQEKGIEHCYVEGPGAHDWDFWDAYIKKALDWLPLGVERPGVSSGNVQ